MSNGNNKSHNNEKLSPDSLQELGELLSSIKKDFEKFKSNSFKANDPKILERLIGIEKDFKIIENDFNELSKDVENYSKSVLDLTIQYQEVMGSVNQLKLGIDEINQRYNEEKAQRLNLFWQLIIPIILSILFFVFGLFFKSCSAIHESNVHGNNSSEYINFESKK